MTHSAALPASSRRSLWAVSVLTYVVLAVALRETRGHFHPAWVLVFAIAFCIWSVVYLQGRTPLRIRLPSAGVAAWYLAAAFVLLMATQARLMYTTSSGRLQLRVIIVSSVLLLVAAGAASRLQRTHARAYLLAGVWLSMLVARLIVLKISPEPHIDVFLSNTQGVDLLLSGHNPYRAAYPDIYGGRYDYQAGFVYWPVVLVLQAVSRFVFGDIRMASVCADCVTWLCAWRLLQRERSTSLETHGWLLTWFAFPVQLFVLEQSWVDPLLVASVAVTILCLHARRWAWSAVAVGVGLATKQYFAVFWVLWAIWMARKVGWLKTVQLAAVSLAVFGGILMPFLLSDAGAFLRMTVFVPLRQAFRPDSFSLLALLYRGGASPSGSWYLLPAFCALVGWAVRLWRRQDEQIAISELGAGAFLVVTSLFLFGKQAFCNYYTFAAFFLWLLLAGSSSDGEPLTSPKHSLPAIQRDS